MAIISQNLTLSQRNLQKIKDLKPGADPRVRKAQHRVYWLQLSKGLKIMCWLPMSLIYSGENTLCQCSPRTCNVGEDRKYDATCQLPRNWSRNARVFAKDCKSTPHPRWKRNKRVKQTYFSDVQVSCEEVRKEREEKCHGFKKKTRKRQELRRS